MKDKREYSADFDHDMTIKYSDENGVLKFPFALSTEEHPKRILLYRRPVTATYGKMDDTESNRRWVEIAYGRARAYLESLGYEVKVPGE